MDAANDAVKALARALGRALRPLVRILIRYGVSYPAFIGVAKQIYIAVAAEEFRISRRKQSVSRIAVLTGLPRKEVARMLERGRIPAEASGEEHSRIARIISGWRYDRRFVDPRGRPALLPFDAAGASFSQLVRQYGADVPARAVLDELMRMEAVKQLKDGRLSLVAVSFVPANLELDKFGILGADVADLVSAIDHNLVAEPGQRFLQRKVTYDNIPREAASKLRKFTAAYGEKLVTRIDALFAKYDRDINPSVKGNDRKRVVLGIWYLEEDYESESDNQDPPEEQTE